MTNIRHRTDASKRSSYKHAFVELMPDNLEEGVLYLCIPYATSAHKCFCGCGREVVTTIHPTKWRLTFDGVHVSLFPSVGSWSLACKSHYWLKNGKILWASSFSDEQIQAVRRRDLAAQDSYFGQKEEAPPQFGSVAPNQTSALSKLAKWWQGK